MKKPGHDAGADHHADRRFGKGVEAGLEGGQTEAVLEEQGHEDIPMNAADPNPSTALSAQRTRGREEPHIDHRERGAQLRQTSSASRTTPVVMDPAVPPGTPPWKGPSEIVHEQARSHARPAPWYRSSRQLRRTLWGQEHRTCFQLTMRNRHAVDVEHPAPRQDRSRTTHRSPAPRAGAMAVGITMMLDARTRSDGGRPDTACGPCRPAP